jgi:hypothetical protein
MKTAGAGSLQFKVQYSDKFYIVVMGFAGNAARLCKWTEKLIWQERIAGSLKVTVYDTQGKPINAAYIGILGPESRSGYTDSSGQITFNDLAPGQYTVTASKVDIKQLQHQLLYIRMR